MGFQPVASSRLTSSTLRGVPSGFDVSNCSSAVGIDEVADLLGELADRQIDAGADVDVDVVAVVLA